MDDTLDAAAKEQVYVHTVYNEIAPHFSQTRYKPWPIVEEFLKQRTAGEIGIDVGCGNGKYLGVNKDVYIIGSDRSDGLVQCAREFGHEVMVADGLTLPHPVSRFDFAISIAVIHHFSTPERRIAAIKHIMSKLKTGGQALIYVWALEQENSRRGYKEGMPQDVLVPWVLQKSKKKHQNKSKDKSLRKEHTIETAEKIQTQEETAEPESDDTNNTKYRYYHLYKKGELEENARAAGATIKRQGYERDNWFVVIQN